MTLYILREKTMLLCVLIETVVLRLRVYYISAHTHTQKRGRICMLCVPWSTQSTVMATRMDIDTQPSADKEK